MDSRGISIGLIKHNSGVIGTLVNSGIGASTAASEVATGVRVGDKDGPPRAAPATASAASAPSAPPAPPAPPAPAASTKGAPKVLGTKAAGEAKAPGDAHDSKGKGKAKVVKQSKSQVESDDDEIDAAIAKRKAAEKDPKPAPDPGPAKSKAPSKPKPAWHKLVPDDAPADTSLTYTSLELGLKVQCRYFEKPKKAPHGMSRHHNKYFPGTITSIAAETSPPTVTVGYDDGAWENDVLLSALKAFYCKTATTAAVFTLVSAAPAPPAPDITAPAPDSTARAPKSSTAPQAVGSKRKKGSTSHEELLNSDDASESSQSMQMSDSIADTASGSDASSDYLVTTTGLVPINE